LKSAAADRLGSAARGLEPPAGMSWAGTAWLAAGTLAIAIGAVESPKLTLAGVLGLLFAAVAIGDLALGVALFTVLIFFSRIPAVSSAGVTLPKLAGALLAGLWLLRVADRNRRVPLLTRAHPAFAYVLITFCGWAVISLLWAPDLGTAFTDATRIVQAIILVFIVFSAIREPRHLWWVFSAFLTGAVFSAVVGLSGVTQPETKPGAEGRLIGGIGDPNELASVLLPALAFALFALCVVRSPLLRVLLMSCVLVVAVAIFQTESRGGIIGLSTMLVAAVILAGPVRARAVAAALATAALGVFYFVLVAPPQALSRITQFGNGSGRTDLWHVALKMFENHPVVGVGVGNFQTLEPSYSLSNFNVRYTNYVVDIVQPVHNTYLHFLVELGLIGFALFAAVLVGAIVLALRAISLFSANGEHDLEILTRGLLVGTIGMLAAFTFISANYEKELPLLLGVLAATFTIARLHAAREQPAAA
jgi:O-antigen ligase